MPNLSTTIGVVVTSLFGGGGLVWVTAWATRRKINAETTKTIAEAGKIDADTESTTMATMRDVIETVRTQLADQSATIARQSDEINGLRTEIEQLRANLAGSVNTLLAHIDKLENTVCELGATPPPRPAVPTMIGD